MEASQAAKGPATSNSVWRRCLFDDAEDAMFVLAPDCSRVVEANAAARQATGLDAEELNGASLQSILLPDDGEDFSAALDAFRVTGRFGYEGGCSIWSGRGQRVRVRLRFQRTGESDQTNVLVVAREVDQEASQERLLPSGVGTVAGKPALERGDREQRTESVRKLEQQRAFIHAIAEETPYLIYIIDVDTLVVRYINRAPGPELGFEEAGRRPETLHDLLALMPVEEHQHLERVIGEWSELGPDEVREDEYFLVGADGTVRTFLGRETLFGTSGGSRQILGTACDITDRKNAEDALRRSQDQLQEAHRRLELAVTGTSDGLWDWDMVGGTVWFSPRAMELLGHDGREHKAASSGFQEFIHPDDLQSVVDAVDRHLKEDAPYEVEIRMRLVTGEYGWFVSRGKATRDEGGVPVRMSGSLRDVTKRRNALELAARSQAEAEHAHQQLVEAIESLTEGFALYDADDRLVICNSRYRDIYDISRDLLVPGMKFEDHVRESAYRGQVAEAVGREEEWVAERVRQHQNPEGVYRQRLGNGRWLEVSERKTRDGGIVGVRTDVTSRMQAVESLRESEAMFRSLTESSPALVAIFQGAHHAYANPEFSSFLGYEHSELMAMSFLDYVHPEDREKVLQRSMDRQQGREVPSRYEIRLLTKTGEERWIDFGGTLIEYAGEPAVLGVALDITTQKLAERDRQESEEVSRTLLEKHIDGVVVTVAGRIRYVNEPLSAMCGWQQANLLGLSFDELIPAAQGWRGACAVTDFVEGAVRESEIVHQDGTLVPIEIVTRRIRLKGEDACLAIVRDISSRKKLEEQARQHREMLARANRVSMLGEMATGLAHELNQPLGAISMLADACRVKLGGVAGADADLVGILEQLAEQSIRAGAIVDRIRKFIGKEKFVHSGCRADELLNGVLAFLTPELTESECRVDVHVADELAEVHVDRVQIEQVMVNLIHNAVDAYREAGISDRRIVIQVVPVGDGFSSWSVTDFGPGMSEEVATRIFDAFYSTKSKGMGMGLAICRTIVEAHGGRIDVTTRRHEGVTFSFTLPVPRGVTDAA
jgi:PAS domain S-box-containing protein